MPEILNMYCILYVYYFHLENLENHLNTEVFFLSTS